MNINMPVACLCLLTTRAYIWNTRSMAAPMPDEIGFIPSGLAFPRNYKGRLSVARRGGGRCDDREQMTLV
ncbi:hypothetical protein CC2G_000393 [Coprinopsis cinerea AmutBmut pab1-1]|nr:hypothetical protein CC2G_000393 [Coprinopsis cinerea AmutBmut pab1-1]